MHTLKKIVSFIASLNTLLGKIASYSLIIMMLILSYEVIARYFFNSPTIWAHELSGFFFAFYLALTGPWVLLRKEHVAVDIIYTRYSEKKQNAADIVSNLIAIFFFVMVFYLGMKNALYSLSINQTSYTVWGPPLWPVKFLIPLSAAFFILQALAGICDSAMKIKENGAK
jgi:TRAP-type mannitol/chloroaromatic compound transport system permease small subunit